MQCFGGAKHMVVMPDALHGPGSRSTCSSARAHLLGRRALHGDLGGGAGQTRSADLLVEKLIPAARRAEAGPSSDPQADYGPMDHEGAGRKVSCTSISASRRRRPSSGSTARGSSWPGRRSPTSWRLPVRRGDAGHAHLQGRRFRPGAFARELRRGAEASLRAPTTTATASPSSPSPCLPRRFLPTASMSAWWKRNFCYPAPALDHLRWLEAFRLRRPQPGTPPSAVSMQKNSKTECCAWPSGTAGRSCAQFDNPKMK